jgi:hypothetical protein
MTSKTCVQILLIIPIYAKVSINKKSSQGFTGEQLRKRKQNTKSNFCPIGDFFKPCPSRAKAGFKKSPSG